MISAFMDEVNEIRDFFKTLLFRGKRDVRMIMDVFLWYSSFSLYGLLCPSFPWDLLDQEIRCVFKVCNKQLTEDHYSALRKHLYAYSSGKLNHRQLIALCEVRDLLTNVHLQYPSSFLYCS